MIVALRNGHEFGTDPTLERYCAAQHLRVSVTGEIDGIVDRYLTERGLTRRVAVTVPNPMVAFAMVESMDLLVSAPRSRVAAHADWFGLTAVKLPIMLPHSQIRVILPKARIADAGLIWLLSTIEHVI